MDFVTGIWWKNERTIEEREKEKYGTECEEGVLCGMEKMGTRRLI